MRTLKRLLLQVLQIIGKSVIVGIILVIVSYFLNLLINVPLYNILETMGIIVIAVGGFWNLAEFEMNQTFYGKPPVFDLKRMKFRNIERDIIPKNCEHPMIVTIAGVVITLVAIALYYYTENGFLW